MILRHKGTIYVCIRKLIEAGSLYFTRAPITPREVTRRFSNILVFVEVFKNGYKNNGICAMIEKNFTIEKLLPSLMV